MFITMFLLFLLLQDIVDSNFRLFSPLSPGGIVGEKSATHKSNNFDLRIIRENAIASSFSRFYLMEMSASTCALLL